jgi:hypothetical protein
MKNTIKLISVFACVILLLNGCKKDGPVTLDSIPPTLTLTIQGGGETYTLRHTEDYTLGAQFKTEYKIYHKLRCS